jgi:hypothetical protein
VSVTATHPATRALERVIDALADAGIDASRDAGSFFPQPVGVLVGLPALVSWTLAGRTYEISVLVVSGDPLNSSANVDRLYALVDDVALVLAVDQYRPSNWRSSVNAEPLPAVELTATATVTETEEP